MLSSVLSGLWLVSVVGLFVQSCTPPSGGGSGEDNTEDPPLPGDPGTYYAVKRDIREYMQQRPTAKVIFRALDYDKNGNIDACEWMEGGMTTNVREFVRILDEIDKNRDNVLSMDEVKALIQWKYRTMEGGSSAEEEI